MDPMGMTLFDPCLNFEYTLENWLVLEPKVMEVLIQKTFRISIQWFLGQNVNFQKCLFCDPNECYTKTL